MENFEYTKASIPEELAEKVKNYDISYVFDKLLYDKKIAKKDIPELETEFKKFVIIAGLKNYPVAMISPLIDEVWHQFILFTKHYKDFCFQTVGFFIGHLPDTPKTPIPVEAGENFRIAYLKYFGPIPSIWFKKMDRASLIFYSQPNFTGRPPKLWSGWAGPEL